MFNDMGLLHSDGDTGKSGPAADISVNVFFKNHTVCVLHRYALIRTKSRCVNIMYMAIRFTLHSVS